jgi:hypothetical protein
MTKITHRGCGGEVVESETKFYKYCSTHDGACDYETCPDAIDIPAITCTKCGDEILGDAMLEGEIYDH